MLHQLKILSEKYETKPVCSPLKTKINSLAKLMSNDKGSLNRLYGIEPILLEFESQHAILKNKFEEDQYIDLFIWLIKKFEEFCKNNDSTIFLFYNFHALTKLSKNTSVSSKTRQELKDLIKQSFVKDTYEDDFGNYQKAYHLSNQFIFYDPKNIYLRPHDNKLIQLPVFSIVSETGLGVLNS